LKLNKIHIRAVPELNVWEVHFFYMGRLEKGNKQYFKFGLVSILGGVKNCLKTEEEPHKLIV